MSINKKLSDRLEFIIDMQKLLGRYTGMLLSLYESKDVDGEYLDKELRFVRNILVQIEGETSESVIYVDSILGRDFG